MKHQTKRVRHFRTGRLDRLPRNMSEPEAAIYLSSQINERAKSTLEWYAWSPHTPINLRAGAARMLQACQGGIAAALRDTK